MAEKLIKMAQKLIKMAEKLIKMAQKLIKMAQKLVKIKKKGQNIGQTKATLIFVSGSEAWSTNSFHQRALLVMKTCSFKVDQLAGSIWPIWLRLV
jgi:hypothetical protein